MRQRRRNALFTFLYPGLTPGSGEPDKDWPYVAIPDSREFISICTQDGCAVFYNAQELRDMASVLLEAADIFDEEKATK